MKTLTLLNGETYEVVDAKAREQIEDMQSDLTVESITAETTEDNESSGYIFYTKGVAYSPFNETISEDNPNYSLLNANGLSIKTGKYVTADDDTTETLNTFSIDNANSIFSLTTKVTGGSSNYQKQFSIDNAAGTLMMTSSEGALMYTSSGLFLYGSSSSISTSGKGSANLGGSGTFTVNYTGGDSTFNYGNLIVKQGRVLAVGIQRMLDAPSAGAIYLTRFAPDPSVTDNAWYYDENFALTRCVATIVDGNF
jgi:hypothetical protein